MPVFALIASDACGVNTSCRVFQPRFLLSHQSRFLSPQFVHKEDDDLTVELMRVEGVQPSCRLSECSTANHRLTSGKEMMGHFTISSKVKEVSRAILVRPRLARSSADDRLMDFHVYVVTFPESLRDGYGSVQQELWIHSRIRIHEGRIQVWNSGGERPEFCDVLERVTQVTDPEARVWRGSGMPTSEQGIRVLGTPLGHEDFVARL